MVLECRPCPWCRLGV
ncbi:hypothetical protein MTR67_043080 [Solanum verrucosum]|uniref:Uncharacterized protein n=1 Tax=Solanum verrucosum TaxID=315347 RepID=A0AAF0UPM7_SOLVR|nr:hypothetical protein MTR67_043080 [Solanum verrucosum]